jgi:hypothetical protein
VGEGQFESKGAGYHKSYQVFNHQLEKEEWEKINNSLPMIKIPLCLWIDKKEMTDDEKTEVKDWSQTGGYLKTSTYEAAWQVWWNEAKKEDKDSILNCPYFDAEIFTKITGLKDFSTDSLKGAEVEVKVNGVSYKAIIL